MNTNKIKFLINQLIKNALVDSCYEKATNTATIVVMLNGKLIANIISDNNGVKFMITSNDDATRKVLYNVKNYIELDAIAMKAPKPVKNNTK